MKKISYILALLVISISLYAKEIEESKKNEKNIEIGSDIYVYGATYKTITKGKYLTFSAYEFWPYINFSMNNVTAKLQLGIDQFMGSGANENYVPIGSDIKGVVKIEQAYVEANIPFLKGVSFTGGVASYETPGALVLSDNAPIFRLKYTFGDNFLSIIYIKINENDENINTDDSQIFGIDSYFKISDTLKISPAIYFIHGGAGIGASSPYRDNIAMLPNILFSFENPVFNLSIAFAYGDGKDKVNNLKYKGYAFDLSFDYNSKNIKVGGFLTAISGENESTSGKYEGFAPFRISGVKGRLMLLENQQKFSTIAADNFADIRYLNYGYIVFGLLSIMDFGVINISLNGGYAQLMEKKLGSNKKDLGFEVDLRCEVLIQENFKILLESAYLNTGEAWGPNGFGTNDIQNSVYLGLGVIVSF